MKTKLLFMFVSALLLSGAVPANAGASVQVATDNFYLSVGDYDYLPYAYASDPAFLSAGFDFHSMMGEYGVWLDLAPFGAVWQPYATSDWRPYTWGHWIYTSYGPSWEGYEPWAWAAYHYGHWIFTAEAGWVWVPGDEWFASDVLWAEGPDALGWMPLPPAGYGYAGGRLTRMSGDWMVGFNNPGFDLAFGGPLGAAAGPLPFFDPAHASFSVNLWTFIDPGRFMNDNYSGAVQSASFARSAFDRRALRFTAKAPARTTLERITRTRIAETPVDVKQVRTSRGSLRVVVPAGAAPLEQLRRWGPRAVQQVIAPAYAAKRLPLKGAQSNGQAALNRVFRQETANPRSVAKAAPIKPASTPNQHQLTAAAPQNAQPNSAFRRPGAPSKPREPVVIMAPEASAQKHAQNPPTLAQGNNGVRIERRGSNPANGSDVAVRMRAEGLLRSRFPALAQGARVESSKGTVTLWGTARTPQERELATRAVSSLAGVRMVQNRMTVQAPPANNRPERKPQQPSH